MKNSIIPSYIHWLERYYSKSKDSSAKQLCDEIAEITDIDELIRLFSTHLTPHATEYGAITFHSQVLTWSSGLEKLKADRQSAIAQITQVPITKENKALRTLLKEILDEHELLLHSQMPSVLQIICNSTFSELIDYIVHLPEAPIVSKPRAGSFASQTPKSHQHGMCLSMLNNLAAAINEKHPLWDAANGLLQNALRIYQDLELVVVSISDDKANNTPSKNNTCVLL